MIKRIEYQNFKIFEKFTLTPGGKNISIYGDNGTGKSTTLDGIGWVINGKDSRDQADAGIKPQGVYQPEVSVEIELHGHKIKKVMTETYTGKGNNKRLKGHANKYFFNDMEKALAKMAFLKEFTENICSPEMFRMLSDPMYFNGVMHHTARREALFSLVPSVSDSDILEDQRFKTLNDVISTGRTIDEHKSVMAERRKALGKDLYGLPGRILEVKNSISDVKQVPADDIEALKAQIKEHQEQGVNKSLVPLYGRRAKVEDEYKLKLTEINSAFEEDKRKLNLRMQVLEQDIGLQETGMKHNTELIKKLHAEIKEMRSEYITSKKTNFTTENCPTCGQEYPDDKIQELIEKFNSSKASLERKLIDDGKSKGKELDDLSKRIENAEKIISDMKAELSEIPEKIKKLDDEHYIASHLLSINKQEAMDPIDIEINELQSDKSGEASKTAIEELESKLSALLKQRATFEASEKSQDRIKELKAEQKKKSNELDEVEEVLALIAKFNLAKDEIMTERINEKFEMVRYQLFKENLNGSTEPCCEAYFKNKHGAYVPWASDSDGERIVAGLDTIRTFQEHYGIYPAVWIDGRESVTKIPDMPCQIINLVVSETDKELRIERN